MSTDEPPTGDDIVSCRELQIVDESGAVRIALGAEAGGTAGILVGHPDGEKPYAWLVTGHGVENADEADADAPTSDLLFFDPAFGHVSVVETLARALDHIEKHHELLEALTRRIESLEEIIPNAKPLGGNPN